MRYPHTEYSMTVAMTILPVVLLIIWIFNLYKTGFFHRVFKIQPKSGIEQENRYRTSILFFTGFILIAALLMSLALR